MKFTQIPSDAFKAIQMNAGILLESFNPETAVVGSIIGATSGGVNFTATPSFTDYGEDIDNCPKNMLELKKLDSWEATMSGTFITVSENLAKMLVGASDIETGDGGVAKIVPRKDVEKADFKDVWWVGDYSDVNSGESAGFCAIHLMNALSTGGFQIQSADSGKGQFAFTFTGHFSMDKQDEVPFEIYIKEGAE